MTRRQLLDAGVTSREIERRLEAGDLRRLHRGVYLAGPTKPQHAREAAAVLACGRGTAVSHTSAAYLSELLPYPKTEHPVEVTVVGRDPGRLSGVIVHRTERLDREEVAHRHGIPLTSPGRTLIDLASCVSAEVLDRAVAEAFALRLTDRRQLLRAVDRAGRRRGVAVLRKLLDGGRRPARSRSRTERRLLALIRRRRLPEPEVNARLGPWEVDFLWREQGLVVETDGYAAHSSPWAFERDRRKAAELEDRGFVVRRISDRQLTGDADLVERRLRRDLGLPTDLDA